MHRPKGFLIAALLGMVAVAASASGAPPDSPRGSLLEGRFVETAAEEKAFRAGEEARREELRARLLASRPVPGEVRAQAGTCSFGQTACNRTETGSLTSSDCTLDSDHTSVDFWMFQGTAGQQVTITLRSSSFDAYLFLLDPTPQVVADDDDGAGGTDARIVYTLQTSGTWTIAVNQLDPFRYGSYTLSVTCTGGGPSCSVGSTSCGRTEAASLNSSDCALDDGTFVEFFTFSGAAGQRVVATMRSSSLDSYLFLVDPDDGVVAEDNDSGGGRDARIDFVLDRSGTWALVANSYTPASGSFTLELSCPSGEQPPPQCTGPCVSDARTACLLGGRFKVTMPAWTDPNANLAGQGTVVRFAEDREEIHPQHGPLSANAFFSMYAHAPSSVEALVRLIKGATINDRYWVFLTGFTGAGYTMRVEDTQTCRVWQRSVQPGTTNVVKDFEAFPFP